jgi:DNA-binding transcriptional MerR regulator
MDEKYLNQLITYLQELSHIDPSEIPGLDLYMDQVTSFLDDHLSDVKRHKNDLALTKTMINNYAKNKLLPPPNKKRYSKDHILMLLFIFYYKGILQLNDIETVLKPLNEKYFHKDGDLNLSDIYNAVFDLEKKEKEHLISDIREKFDRAKTTFSTEDSHYDSLSDSDREELQLFSFLCELGFDVYLKKLIMETIIDHLREMNVAKEAEERALKKMKHS